MNKNLKIEIHLLQNFAPSCLNRDDTNTPKTCIFGGATRARVSSQSWKRAVRDTFRGQNSELVGLRTKRMAAELQKQLGADFDPVKTTKFLEECYSKMDGKRPLETAVLVFTSTAEIDEAAKCLREGIAVKEAMERLKAVRLSADIALFGRMLAEKPDRNTDAACQVAHALSTHAVDYETDFYTAVDDVTRQSDETGAGMLGTQGFNSACFYRYALVDYSQLVQNMGGDATTAHQALEAFLRAFTLSVPAAKQNSHAAQNLPSFGLFVVRDEGAPISLANAFARPVRSEDLIGASISALGKYQGRMAEVYGLYSGATQAVFHDREGNKELSETLAGADTHTFEKAVAVVMKKVRGEQLA